MAEFFLGITLPDDINKEVEAWRRRFKAPKTPPHITLIPPFRWDLDERKLRKVLQETAIRHQVFELSCRGIGHFGRSVIFIDIEENQALFGLQRDLSGVLEHFGIKPERRRYHPHLTLATCLRGDKYDLYLEQLMGYNPKYSFDCRSVAVFTLVTANNLKQWQQVYALPLKE